MESYFACSQCGAVTKLNETQMRCPVCNCMSGTFMSEPPLQSKAIAQKPATS